MVNYIIREAAITDVEPIKRLFSELCLRESDNDDAIDLNSYESVLNYSFQNEDRSFFVAEHNEEILGYIETSIRKSDYMFDEEDYAYICNYNVRDSIRGGEYAIGISYELLKRSEKWAKDKGIRYLNSDVMANNKFVVFCSEKLGFERHKIRFVKKIIE